MTIILPNCLTPPATVGAEWGLACPRCGSDEHIQIELVAYVVPKQPALFDLVDDPPAQHPGVPGRALQRAVAFRVTPLVPRTAHRPLVRPSAQINRGSNGPW